MRPEDLSRKQWVIIGLLLGLMFSYLRLHIGPPDPNQTHTLASLERALLRPPTHGGDGRDYPWIKDMVVYPPAPLGAAGAASSPPQMVVLVTFQARIPVEKQWQWIPGAVHFRQPLDPLSRVVSGSDMTVRAYLDGVGQAADKGSIYRYAWWAEPKWVYVTWTGMTMLMVGGVWPLVLSLLIGAGFGRASEERKPSLWQQWNAYRQDAARRARTSASDPGLPKRPQGGNSGLTPQEMDRLSSMEADLQGFLAAGRAGAHDDADEAPSVPAIRPLTAGPAEPPRIEPEKKDDKSYGGTFYPTVAHGKPRRPEADAGDSKGA